jgi:hypothetical protein
LNNVDENGVSFNYFSILQKPNSSFECIDEANDLNLQLKFNTDTVIRNNQQYFRPDALNFNRINSSSFDEAKDPLA